MHLSLIRKLKVLVRVSEAWTVNKVDVFVDWIESRKSRAAGHVITNLEHGSAIMLKRRRFIIAGIIVGFHLIRLDDGIGDGALARTRRSHHYDYLLADELFQLLIAFDDTFSHIENARVAWNATIQNRGWFHIFLFFDENYKRYDMLHK